MAPVELLNEESGVFMIKWLLFVTHCVIHRMYTLYQFFALMIMYTILFEIFHFTEQSQTKVSDSLVLKKKRQVVRKEVSIFIHLTQETY